jgi:hypothetical protein
MPARGLALALMILGLAGTAMAEPAKTSKERLSDKAADDQRVDNCGVPPERRGPVARPDCSGKPAPAAPVTSVPTAPR